MKKRILYIILGMMLFAKVGVGQSISLSTNFFDVNASPINYNCGSVRFEADPASLPADYYNLLWSPDNGVSVSFTFVGLGFIGDPTSYIKSGYYKAEFVSYTDGSLGYSLNIIQVTVNTVPNLTSSLTPTAICDKDLFTYSATSNTSTITTSFTWSRPLTSGISNLINSGTNSISEILNNTTNRNVSVVYNYTLISNGCTKNQNVTLIVKPTPTVAAITPQIKCNTIASDVINFSGTVTGTTYAWTNSQSSIGIAASGSGTISSTILTNSTSSPVVGTFTVTPTASSCSGPSGTFSVTVNPRPTATITNTSTSICNISDLSANMNVTAFGNWTITLNDGGKVNGTGSGDQTFIRRPNVTTSYFIIDAIDENCSSNLSDLSGTWTVTVNPTPSVATITPQIKCNTVASNVIIFSGTVSGTTYAWTNSQSTIGIAASGSGTITSTTLTNSTNSPIIGIFTVTPTANSCTGPSSTFSITVNPTPTVATITPQIRCNTIASDVINFSGTVTGTTYAWTNSQSSIGIAGSGSGTISSTTLTNGTASPIIGLFTVTPTANSCAGPAGTFTITVNPTPTVAAITSQIKCNNLASDIINFSGTVTGTTYAWTNSQSSIGISVSGSGTISSTTLKNSTTSPIVGTITVIPTANSCAGPAGTFTITVNPTPTIAAITSQIKCNNLASDIINFSGTVTGTTYSWTNSQSSIGISASGSGTISSTTLKNSTTSPIVGIITVTPTANSCAGHVGTFSITVNPTPTKPTLTSPIICEGTTATITGPSGVYTYTWIVPTGVATSTSNTVSTSKAGTYSLTITDANTCTSEVGIGTVTVNSLPTVKITDPSAVCAPGTVDLTATAITNGSTSSLTYSYFTNATATTSLSNSNSISTTGSYYIKGTDTTTKCFKIGMVVATINALPIVAITNPSAVCAPGTIDLTATAITAGSTSSLTYSYFTNATATTSLSNANTISTTGSYYIKGTDTTTKCFKIGTVVTTVNALPTLIITNPSAVCAPGTIDLTATAITAGSTSSLTYSYWTNNTATTSLTNTNTISITGSYYIKGTDTTTKCFKIGTVLTNVNPTPTVTITNPIAVCAPGTVDLTATAITAGSTSSLTYSYWTNNTATSSLSNANTISTTGAYYIKGTDTTTKCFKIGMVVTTINPIPTFNILSPSVCSGSQLKITANPLTGASTDYNYTWQVPTGVANPGNVSNFTTTIAGVYTATIKNKTTACESLSSNAITSFYPLPSAAAIVANNNKVIVNKTLNLTAAASGGKNPYYFTWTPNPTINYSISGQENAVFTALKEGKVKFKYQVKDANNCEVNSADYEITIESEDIVLILPNAFTPNGDGKNDEFKIVATNTLGEKSFLYFEIYNRNGKMIKKVEKITDGWNGKSLAGDMQDMGIYFVKLARLDKDGKQVVDNAQFYLLK